MENNLNTQESSSLNQTVNEGTNQKVSILLKIVLVLTWLLYIPFAFFIFAMSGMASDSGSISFTLDLIVFLVNTIPLVLMVVISFIALKKKSVFIALLPVLLVFSMQILISVFSTLGSVSPKRYISFDSKVPHNVTLFVCQNDSIFSLGLGRVFEVTGNITLVGWKDTGGARDVGKIKYNKIMLRDEKDRIKMETCKNPNGETIANIVQSYPLPSFPDISFSSGVVPTSTLFFICPNEKVVKFNNNVITDVTNFVTKNGWKSSQDSIIGELSANNGLIAYSEEDKNAMITCQNIEGKTIADVTSKKPALSH